MGNTQLLNFDSIPQDKKLRVTLGGKAWVLRVYWLPAAQSWFIDILDEKEETILNGFRLTVGMPVAPYLIREAMGGALLVVAAEEGTRSLWQFAFGKTHRLIFREDSE